MTTEPTDDEDQGYALVLVFDTDEPEFTRGFECGQLWEQLSGGEYLIDRTLHAWDALRTAVDALDGTP